MDLGPAELIIILLIVLLVFGGTKLPKLARSLGQAQKEFKTGLKEGAQMDDEPTRSRVDEVRRQARLRARRAAGARPAPCTASSTSSLISARACSSEAVCPSP